MIKLAPGNKFIPDFEVKNCVNSSSEAERDWDSLSKKAFTCTKVRVGLPADGAIYERRREREREKNKEKIESERCGGLCVCVRERERARERQQERERIKESASRLVTS